MSRKYFGTDGVRGKVGQWPITPEFALKLGYVAGRVLSRRGTGKVIIGKDTRISGYMLESALVAGLSAAGMDAVLTGPLPTPAIAYLTKTLRAEAGIVISASHNPYEDNGIKFFSRTGEKLDDAVELAIEAELEKPMECVASRRLGRASRMNDATGRYIEFCKAAFPARRSLTGLKVVVDCAHGAGYQIAPAVFSELGADVYALGNKPDGLNINHQCGSTSLALLQEMVLERQADLGIALDGDGDRVMMVDGEGHIVDGDKLLYVLARQAHTSGTLVGGVAGTLMTNMGLELALAELDIPFLRTKVGDRYVMEALIANNWFLGGEASGHLICRDLVTTGDAVVSALKVLAVIEETGQSLAVLTGDMPHLPQITVNVPIAQDASPLDHPGLKMATREVEEMLGIGTASPAGRLLVRKSGTEPLIRVMVEAHEAELAEQCAQRVAHAMREVNGADPIEALADGSIKTRGNGRVPDGLGGAGEVGFNGKDGLLPLFNRGETNQPC